MARVLNVKNSVITKIAYYCLLLVMMKMKYRVLNNQWIWTKVMMMMMMMITTTIGLPLGSVGSTKPTRTDGRKDGGTEERRKPTPSD